MFAEDALLGAVPRACAAPQAHGVDIAARLVARRAPAQRLTSAWSCGALSAGGGKQSLPLMVAMAVWNRGGNRVSGQAPLAFE